MLVGKTLFKQLFVVLVWLHFVGFAILVLGNVVSCSSCHIMCVGRALKLFTLLIGMGIDVY